MRLLCVTLSFGSSPNEKQVTSADVDLQRVELGGGPCQRVGEGSGARPRLDEGRVETRRVKGAEDVRRSFRRELGPMSIVSVPDATPVSTRGPPLSFFFFVLRGGLFSSRKFLPPAIDSRYDEPPMQCMHGLYAMGKGLCNDRTAIVGKSIEP